MQTRRGRDATRDRDSSSISLQGKVSVTTGMDETSPDSYDRETKQQSKE